MKNKSYIGISFIILIFGIIFIPKIVDRIKNGSVIQNDRMSLSNEIVKNDDISYVNLNGITNIFFDYIKILENSIEIHLLDSVWGALVY